MLLDGGTIVDAPCDANERGSVDYSSIQAHLLGSARQKAALIIPPFYKKDSKARILFLVQRAETDIPTMLRNYADQLDAQRDLLLAYEEEAPAPREKKSMKKPDRRTAPPSGTASDAERVGF